MIIKSIKWEIIDFSIEINNYIIYIYIYIIMYIYKDAKSSIIQYVKYRKKYAEDTR